MKKNTHTLSELCEVIAGQHIAAALYSDNPDGVPYLTGPADFGYKEPRVTKWTNSPKVFAQDGDILITVKGSGVGKLNLGCNAAIGRQLMAIRPRQGYITQNYLFAFLRAVENRIHGMAQGAAIPGITKQDIANLELYAPPISEQKRIAGILDAADALRVKRRDAIASLNTLLQSTFLTLFGDPITNPMGWKTVKLSSLIEAEDKINYGVVQPGDDYPEGKPLIRVGDFVGGELNKEKIKLISPEIESKYIRSRLNGQELLVSCVGSIGTVCKVPEEAKGFNIARAVARVPLKKDVNRDFMLYCLRSETVQRYFLKETRTVSQPTLNISLIKSAPVIQPPLDLQRHFATIVKSIEEQKAQQRAHLAELDTLFASLQSRAFNGEL